MLSCYNVLPLTTQTKVKYTHGAVHSADPLYGIESTLSWNKNYGSDKSLADFSE